MSDLCWFGWSRRGIIRALSLVIAVSMAAAILAPLMTIDRVRAWSTEPEVNTPLCTAASDQANPQMVSDGVGGAIITWQDYRGSDYDIYAQRVNAAGVPQWTVNGAPVCTTGGDQAQPMLLADGAGGAIITWQDYRGGNYDIYAQRVNAAGVPQWAVNGVAVCTAAGDQAEPAPVSDGAGGAIITWQDHRSGGYDIYAQRVDGAGLPQWTGNGAPVCTVAYDQAYPSLTADGAGGAVIGWQDARGGYGWDIYSQRVSAFGEPQWMINGVATCAATNHQESPGLIADGSGGAFIAWTDNRTGFYDVYAQRLGPSGTPQWTGDGVAICTSDYNQLVTSGISDSSGGIILTWTDQRVGVDFNIYAQRVSPSGECLWADNGSAVCAATGFQMIADTAADGSGGAIMAWMDYRNGLSNCDVYAQRLDSSGAPQWTHDGLAVCTADDTQMWTPLVGNGSGGAIIVWMDHRNGDSYDIYAQGVNANGVLGTPPNQPMNQAPGNGATGVSVTPTLQSSAFGDLDNGDVHSSSQWRVAATAGDYSNAVFDSGVDSSHRLEIVVPSGKLNGNTTYYWQVRHQDRQGGWSEWSVETSFTTRNRAPDRPSNIQPASGAAAVSAIPTLQSSPFSDPDTGDPQTASEWRVTATSGDYSNPIFNSHTDHVNLSQILIPPGNLSGNSTYYWQLRHQDSHGGWSDWSAESSFTTRNQAPNKPFSVSPEDGAAGTSTAITLQSSTFSDPDTGETHAASHWRVTTKQADYSGAVFESSSDNVNLIEMAVPPGTLKGNTTYYWQVRHQDGHGDWSVWSWEASFTTQKESQAWIWIVVGLAAAVAVLAGGIGGWLVLRGRAPPAS